MTFERYFDGETRDGDRDRFGFIRLRVSGDGENTGYVSAYTVDGTELMVRAADLLRVADDADPDAPGGE